MKKLFRLIFNRWVLTALGLIFLGLIIWFIGGAISIGSRAPLESEIARVVAIALMVLAFVVHHFRKLLRANQASKGMVDGLVEVEAAEPDRSAEEVGQLRERFEEAVQMLRKTKGKGARGKLSLYDLPWYIMIGPPGSGKTTALLNSGLDFPLAEKFGDEPLEGVGGTRNCDWLFTDQAILLDTAGRYTTQDSDSEIDRSAWEGFLGLLKKYRRRRPINGVIVAISLLDLMTQDEHQRAAHSRAIKRRVQELDEFFGIRFPVYVVLTKTDLVAGFNEFFLDDLSAEEREQVWGFTFPIEVSESEQGGIEQIGSELDSLFDRLGQRVVHRMSRERDPRRRAAIYSFPRQLASLRQPLERFLAEVFRGSRFDRAPMLRGVYLTSATQEGTPIDRLMGMVARSFGLDQQTYAAHGGKGRSYFIKRLLTDVVFRESEIAGTNRKLELQRAWLQRAAYIGCVAVVAGALVLWTLGYFSNKALLRDVQAASDEALAEIEGLARPGDNTEIQRVVEALNSVRAIEARADRGGLFTLGLDQGGRLARRARDAYDRVLHRALLPRLLIRLEREMRGGTADPERLYLVLKTYLMIGMPDHYDPDEVLAWFEVVDFPRNLPRETSAEFREQLSGHLEALFDERIDELALPLDEDLIDDTQRVVSRLETHERVYSRLRAKAQRAGLEGFSILDATGPRGPIVFSRKSGLPLSEEIDGLFTRDGYQFFTTNSFVEIDDLLDETWIIGESGPGVTDTLAVRQRVAEAYLDDYIREYDGLIADLRLAAFSSPAEASNILNELSRRRGSPLVLFLQGIARQTQLENRLSSAVAESSSRLEGVANRFCDLIDCGDDDNDAPATTEGNPVDRHFAWLRDLLGGDDIDLTEEIDISGTDAQVIVDLLDELYQFMSLVEDEGGAGGQIPDAVREQGRSVIQRTRNEANRQPELIDELLSEAAGRSQRLADQGVMASIQDAWESEALGFCREAIEGRYPIDRTSPNPIRLIDFADFFKPSGIMDRFFDDYLANRVDTSARPWRLQTTSTDNVRISPAAIAQFERAQRIADTYFRTASELPSVTFDLTPIDLDAAVFRFSLDLDGQTLSYEHGPTVPTALQWPGPSGGGDVRIEFTAPNGAPASIDQRGPWAWFEVLDGAVSETDRAETYEVRFAAGGRYALFDLAARSRYNPFDFEELAEFSCPGSVQQ